MSWVEKKISDLGNIVTGKTPSTKVPEYFGGEYPFVTPSDIEYGHYYVRKTETTVTEQAKNKHKNQFIPKDSVLFTCIGNTMGKCAIAAQECISNQQINAVVANDDHDPKFLYYLLHYHRNLVRGIGMGGGAATPIINKTTFGNIRLRVPAEKPDQKAISSLLEKYDDLIENNKRRIELLEDSARQLYKEWFVRFRFPGHEYVKIIDGVPEGWRRLTVAECSEKPTYGFTASADTEPVGPKLLRITDIVPSSIDWPRVPYCLADENTTKKYLLAKGDIVVARTGATVGYAKLMPELNEEVVYASYLVRFRPKAGIIDEQILGIFVESEGYKEHVRSHAGGAAQPNANAQVLGSAKLNVPPPNLQSNFKDYVEPIFKQKALLQSANFSLAKTRDILLPKLMSGEVAV